MLDISGPLPNNLKYRVIISYDDIEEDVDQKHIGGSIDNVVTVLKMHKDMLAIKPVVADVSTK